MMNVDKLLININYPDYPVYISHSPSEKDLNIFINQITLHNIKHIVRLCEPFYDSNNFTKLGIKVYDWVYEDGTIPSQEIIDNWIELIKLKEPILVHCKAGLGRAPFLATLGLIENNVDPYDAIDIIRNVRPKALNKIQLDYLIKYKPKKLYKSNSLKKLFGKLF